MAAVATAAVVVAAGLAFVYKAEESSFEGVEGSVEGGGARSSYLLCENGHKRPIRAANVGDDSSDDEPRSSR